VCCSCLLPHCHGRSLPSPDREKIRAVGGEDGCLGRVDVWHRGCWGTVCNKSWDVQDAEVACRQLGCGPAVSALHEAAFGMGMGWRKCQGMESFLQDFWAWPGDDCACQHKEDTAVCCSGEQQGRDPCPDIGRDPCPDIGRDLGKVHFVLSCSLTSQEQECSCRLCKPCDRWGAASVELDVLWPLPMGPCSRRATPWAARSFLLHRAKALGPVPVSLSNSTEGAIWVGCVRDIYRHTHGVFGGRFPDTCIPTLSAQLSIFLLCSYSQDSSICTVSR